MTFFSRYEAANPGQFDYAMYLKGQGICSEEAYKEIRPDPEDSKNESGIFEKVRSFFSGMLNEGLTEHDAGMIRAVLLGEKAALDTEIRDLYQDAGISHLLAVSGLHGAILGMGVFNMIRKRKFSRGVSGTAAGIFIILYLLMIGAPGSGVRAAVMLFVLFAAKSL